MAYCPWPIASVGGLKVGCSSWKWFPVLCCTDTIDAAAAAKAGDAAAVRDVVAQSVAAARAAFCVFVWAVIAAFPGPGFISGVLPDTDWVCFLVPSSCVADVASLAKATMHTRKHPARA